MKKCTILYNTKWGYVMQPITFPSIASAIRDAKERQMAFRIFINNQCIKRGWYHNSKGQSSIIYLN